MKVERVGILATNSILMHRIYIKPLEKSNIIAVNPSDEN